MKGLTFVALMLGGLMVGGCQTTHYAYDPPKPVDQMTQTEWCDYAKFFLTNPQNSEETTRTVQSKMRAKNCRS